MMHLERSASYIGKKTNAQTRIGEAPPLRIDEDRMDRVLKESRTTIPSGLTVEEVRAFILGTALTRR